MLFYTVYLSPKTYISVSCLCLQAPHHVVAPGGRLSWVRTRGSHCAWRLRCRGFERVSRDVMSRLSRSHKQLEVKVSKYGK